MPRSSDVYIEALNLRTRLLFYDTKEDIGALASAGLDSPSIPLAQKGAASGVATLGADSKLTPAQNPSIMIAPTVLAVSANVLDSVLTSAIRSALWKLTLKKGTNTRTMLVIGFTDGGATEVDWSVFGEVTYGDVDVTITCVNDGTHLQLVATPATTGWTASGQRISQTP
jgi:hypothetical protein